MKQRKTAKHAYVIPIEVVVQGPEQSARDIARAFIEAFDELYISALSRRAFAGYTILRTDIIEDEAKEEPSEVEDP